MLSSDVVHVPPELEHALIRTLGAEAFLVNHGTFLIKLGEHRVVVSERRVAVDTGDLVGPEVALRALELSRTLWSGGFPLIRLFGLGH